ncbi:MAG: tetratricopeptide repeat protein, partial [Patescibacteria group bacterium]
LKYVNKVALVAGLALLVILNWWVLWVVAIAGMAGVVAFGSLNHEKFSVSRFILPMTVIVIGVFLMVVNFNFTNIKKNLPIEVAPSFGLSTEVTKSALKEKLITGYGPETFGIAFDKYGASKLADSTLSTAKFFDGTAEIFTSVTQGGVLMVLALLVLLWCFIQGVVSYVGLKESVSGSNAQFIWASLFAVGVAFVLYPFNLTLVFLAYALLALAVVSIWGDRGRVFSVEDNVGLSLVSSLGFIAGLILVLVGIYFGFSVYFGDVKYAQALVNKDIDKSANELVSAVNWNNKNDRYYRSASQVALGLLSRELNKKADASDTQLQARIQNYMSSAISLAKTATTLEPRESANWENLGIVYQNLLGLVDGVDALSEAAFLKATELRPGDASYYNQIGNLYLAKSQIARQLASGSPNSAQLLQLSVASLASAESNYKKAIELSNNFGLAIYNLGVVYDREGKLLDAIKQLERIAPFNSDQPNLLFELGLLYYRAGQKDKAFDSFQKVLVLQPDFANAHWYLGLIYEERKDIPNAIIQMEKILSVDSNKDNETVITKLQQLRAGQTGTGKVIDQKPL